MELDIVPEEDFMYQLAVKEWEQKLEAFKEEVEQKLNQAKQGAKEAKREAKEAKRQAEKAKREQAIRMANKLLKNGMEKHEIADILECNLEELEELLSQSDLNTEEPPK